MKITPDLIPHAEFHTGEWLQSAERPSWYYFKKKVNRNIITNKDFIKSVDEPLKELVQFLHQEGIKTTPSCSGHHFRKERFEKIYAELEEDSRPIRSNGLMLRDIETGELYLYKNKNYELPWTQEKFLEKMVQYQHKGVLGFRPGNREKIKRRLLSLTIDHAKVVERDAVLLFLTEAKDQSEIPIIWKAITEQVRSVFDPQPVLEKAVLI
jgi:hypothetical protein